MMGQNNDSNTGPAAMNNCQFVSRYPHVSRWTNPCSFGIWCKIKPQTAHLPSTTISGFTANENTAKSVGPGESKDYEHRILKALNTEDIRNPFKGEHTILISWTQTNIKLTKPETGNPEV